MKRRAPTLSPRFRDRLQFLLIILLAIGASTASQTRKTVPGEIAKPDAITTNDYRTSLLINELFNYVTNTWSGGYNPFTSNPGLEYPAGSGHSLLYQGGFFWGGYQMGRPTPKGGGSLYRTGLQAGRIITPGTSVAPGVYAPNCVSDNPALPKYRVYKVRPDVRPGVPLAAVVTALTKEATLIARYEPGTTAQTLYDQYLLDWNEWPGKGSSTDPLGLAPFADLNGNGTYEPATDLPGQPGADLTLYYVANDNDSARVSSLAGSPPMGIEMHRTIWGYDRRGYPKNVIYTSTKLINKSGYAVDSMFVADWGDVDLGDSYNDFMACDTALQTGYAYNSPLTDYTYGYNPPAYGVVLLSGPVLAAAPSDSAIIGLRYRHGYRNLPMSSFALTTHSYLPYVDPIQGAGGDVQNYCLLRGRNPSDCAPYIDSTTMQPTLFPYAGDPVRRTGFTHEQYGKNSGDWRLSVASGPFTFASGDTQEIVFAQVVARGGDRLASVTEMKDLAREVIRAYRGLFKPQPGMEATVRYATSTTTLVGLFADLAGVSPASARAILRRRDGSVAATVPLFDDGAHADSAANDGYFGGSIPIPMEPLPVSIDCEVTDVPGRVTLFPKLVEGVTVAGPVRIDDYQIVSDNLNDDRQADFYENVRYGITLVNATSFTLRNLRISQPSDITVEIPSLAPGAEFAPVYDPARPETYFTRQIPSTPNLARVDLSFSIWDGDGNVWSDTVRIPVSSRRYAPSTGHTAHVAGWANGAFDLLLTDLREIRDHRYRIRAASSETPGGAPTITLEDSTDGRVLLTNHPLPDPLGHTIPVTDGFKVVLGGIMTPGSGTAYVTEGGTGSFWAYASGRQDTLEGYGGRIGRGYLYWHSGGTPYENLRDVRIRFTAVDSSGRGTNPADTNISFAHRYLANADAPPAQSAFAPFIVNAGPGYPYQDYLKNLCFAAYDMNATPPRRLMVGYLENNVAAGRVDGRYCPPTRDNVSAQGPREWFFIFDLPYRETPDPSLQVDLLNTRTPLMWFGTPARGVFISLSAGRMVNIDFPNPPVSGDIWSFNPVDVLGGIDKTIPDQMQLFLNYPNPFNAGTTIKYGLPADSRVTLRIYNILGQEVRTLMDEIQLEGFRTVAWDGRNGAGALVSTGVYFFRLQAATTEATPREITSVGKMMLLR